MRTIFCRQTKSRVASLANNYMVETDTRQQSLTSYLAKRLIEGSQPNEKPSQLQPIKVCIAVAGGGSNAASAIASTPGASSLLLEAIITYDRRSYVEFVSSNVKKDDEFLMNLEESYDQSFNSPAPFGFCSTTSAVLLSRSALNRSLSLTRFQSSVDCIGIGCTSSLVGRVSPEGDDIGKRKGRKSRARIAISSLCEGTNVYEVELDGCNLRNDGKEVPSSRRDRAEEDAVVSNLILLALVQKREQMDESESDAILKEVLNRGDDVFTEERIHHTSQQNNTAADGATRIINEEASIVLILPTSPLNEVSPSGYNLKALFADGNIPFPQDGVLIVPGSFNPPHKGHLGLVNAAAKALERLEKQEEVQNKPTSASILTKMWGKFNTEEESKRPVFFELSVTNADKPPLGGSEVQRRVNFFESLPASDMPNDWAIALTDAPLFAQKANILENLIPNDFDKKGATGRRKISFVLGSDTMVRILNPKYYDDSRDNMIAALVKMQRKGIHIVVGGRLEQGSGSAPKFTNGQKEVESLPEHLWSMFTLLSEEEFRLDISSTELRKGLV